MAVKDHSLDSKIVESAKKEFLELGYSKASLHKIAKNAGTTTGALYTRYKNKDALFMSLIEGAINEVKQYFEPFSNMYSEVARTKDPDLFLEVIRRERNIYLEFLFNYYDECVLMFLKSEGSSINETTKQMMSYKAKSTVEFLKSISKSDADFDGIEFIMQVQYDYFKRLIESGCDRDKAVSCMRTAEVFFEAGWRDLFQRILP